MRKISKRLSGLVIGIMIFSIIGCTTVPPKTVVSNFLNAIQKDDMVTAAQYVQNNSEDNNFTDELKSEDPEGDEARKLIFSKIKYEILSSTTKDNTAEVKAKITSVDLLTITTEVMGKLMPLAFAAAFSDNPDSEMDNLADQYFKNALSDPNAPMVTNDVVINMTKLDGKWVIIPDDNLTNALCGNAGKLADIFGDEG